MKYFLILILFFASCREYRPKMIVINKYYTDYYDRPMPNGICRYYFYPCPNCDAAQFQDSCHKYNVGDTIPIK